MTAILTSKERSLLKIVKGSDDGASTFIPRIDHAHSSHQATLHDLKSRGLLAFTWDEPRMHITEAGRAALLKSGVG